MKVIKNQEFGGERPLFESHGLRLENVSIHEGESAIKECSDIEAEDCFFEGHYPFWHVHGFRINNCHFAVGARSALWYSDHLKMTNTVIDGPKMFREMSDIDIENVKINDADEIFWRCKNINIKKLTWLSVSDLVKHTAMVFVVVLAMSAVIWLLDLGFSAGVKGLATLTGAGTSASTSQTAE